VMEEYCSRRPRLEEIGLTSREWLGRPSDPSENGLPVSRHSELGHALKQVQVENSADTISTQEQTEVSAEEVKFAYVSALTIDEEVIELLHDVRLFLRQCIINSRTGRNMSGSELVARRDAIISQLGIHMDGTFARLPPWKQIWFGTALDKLTWKLRKARMLTKEILDAMEDFTPGEEDMKDRCLIQHFVLEQMSPFKRFAVSSGCSPSSQHHCNSLRSIVVVA